MSRNETRGHQGATEEEYLQEVVAQFRDAYERDLEEKRDPCESDMKVLYPRLMEAVDNKVSELKELSHAGFSRLCCVPSFALGLVMASRIRRHYTHASWFTIKALGEMLDVHGAVSGEICQEKRA